MLIKYLASQEQYVTLKYDIQIAKYFVRLNMVLFVML
jgi:hypothetical protein